MQPLAGDLARFVGAALCVNALIFAFGFGGGPGGSSGPPGWLAGAVWTGLFALFGTARWLLRRPGASAAGARRLLLAFAGLCLAYPFYTAGLSNASVGLAGNVVTAAAAAALMARIGPLSRAAALCVSPVLPWLAFASWTIVAGWAA